jgi:hypothetical protein
LLAHTATRDGQVLATLAGGSATAGEIAARLPWTRRNRAFEGLGEFHQQFAVSETIAHLQHLHAAGLVARETEPNRIRYALVA